MKELKTRSQTEYDICLLVDFESVIDRRELLISGLPAFVGNAEWGLSREFCEGSQQNTRVSSIRYAEILGEHVLHVLGIFHSLRTASLING